MQLNCEICHSLLKAADRQQEICKDCSEIERTEFQKLKRYLIKKPKATILDIKADTTISMDLVQRWKRQKRI